MRRKNIIVFLAGLALILAACASGDVSELTISPVVGAIAPDFTLQSITDETVSLSDYRGKGVLVNFWATWCGPCRLEMPDLQARFEKYSDDFVILAVDNDEPKEAVAAFFDELSLTFPALLDPGAKTQELYLVRGYPSSVFIDRNGVIQVVHIGIMTEEQMDNYLSQIGIGEG